MGMDSLMSVELKGRLEKASGRTLTSTLTFNYPTVRALASYLSGMLMPEGDRPVGTEPAVHRACADGAPPTVSPLPRDDLSEDELAALLSEALHSI
jgi:hypothetical protein